MKVGDRDGGQEEKNSRIRCDLFLKRIINGVCARIGWIYGEQKSIIDRGFNAPQNRIPTVPRDAVFTHRFS
jgi:hypothetical protein